MRVECSFSRNVAAAAARFAVYRLHSLVPAFFLADVRRLGLAASAAAEGSWNSLGSIMLSGT